MNQEEQRMFDSLVRVQKCTDANVGVFGSITTSEGRREVDAAVDEVLTHHTTQGVAVRALQGGIKTQKAMAAELVASHLLPIAKFARTKLRGTPDFGELTQPVDTAKPKQLIGKARSMAVAAAKYMDRFTAAGFAADTVDRLTAATNALAEAITQRAAARGRRKLARNQITAALLRGRDGVRVLDSLISQQLKPNDPLLMTWKSESRVEDKPGRVRPVKAAVNAPATAVVAPPVTPPALTAGH
jgi:hypothetical protein